VLAVIRQWQRHPLVVQVSPSVFFRLLLTDHARHLRYEDEEYKVQVALVHAPVNRRPRRR
jgi:hypothetical protein